MKPKLLKPERVAQFQDDYRKKGSTTGWYHTVGLLLADRAALVELLREAERRVDAARTAAGACRCAGCAETDKLLARIRAVPGVKE